MSHEANTLFWEDLYQAAEEGRFSKEQLNTLSICEYEGDMRGARSLFKQFDAENERDFDMGNVHYEYTFKI